MNQQPLPKKEEKINNNEMRFCEEYVKSNNALQSYKIAYPNANENTAIKNAYTILKRPKIAEYINNIAQQVQQTFKVDREYLIKEALELIKDCKTTSPDQPFKDRGNWNKAIDILAKLTNSYAPIQIESKQEIIIRFDFDMGATSNDKEVIDIEHQEDDNE